VRTNGVRVGDLDQVHIPDPLAQELCTMRMKINEMRTELENIKNKLNQANGNTENNTTSE
jgi:serine O-acetyltransferase